MRTINRLEIQTNPKDTTSNAFQNEVTYRKEQETRSSLAIRPTREPIKAFPLNMVLQACPQIRDCGPSGNVESWRDLMFAAVVVRSMLGVSPSAYQDASKIR